VLCTSYKSGATINKFPTSIFGNKPRVGVASIDGHSSTSAADKRMTMLALYDIATNKTPDFTTQSIPTPLDCLNKIFWMIGIVISQLKIILINSKQLIFQV
jgi:hypothetical protein